MAIIYKIHYDNVGKAYIGSSVPADPNYWGSMSPMGLRTVRSLVSKCDRRYVSLSG